MADGVEPLANRVGELLPQLAILLTRFVRDLPEGVTVAQAFLLHHLRTQGPCTAAKVGEWMGVTSGPVTSLTKRLVQRGLVIRNRDNLDRRVVWFQLSPEGEKLVQMLDEHSRRKWEMVIQALGPEEARSAVRLMENTILVLGQLR